MPVYFGVTMFASDLRSADGKEFVNQFEDMAVRPDLAKFRVQFIKYFHVS